MTAARNRPSFPLSAHLSTGTYARRQCAFRRGPSGSGAEIERWACRLPEVLTVPLHTKTSRTTLPPALHPHLERRMTLKSRSAHNLRNGYLLGKGACRTQLPR